MLSDVKLGQFINTKSVIHKIDPRLKLLFNAIFVILIFFSKSYISFLSIFLTLFVVICLAKIPFKLYLNSLKSILFFILITFIVNVFFIDGKPLLQIGFLKVTYEGLNISAFAILKLFLLILTSTTLLFVTSMPDLALGLEKILSPLKIFKINVRDISTMITISLRFIPIFIDETDKIITAQKLRGANFNSGNIFKRAKLFVNIFVPLFVSSLKKADDLYLAMESRCYSYDCFKTKMKDLKFKNIDIMSVFVIIIVSIIIMWVNFKL